MANLVKGVADPALAELTVGDVEIGAVEIKNGTDDTRAVVDATYGLAVDVKRIGAGTSIIGKTGIDQTTDGTTNRTVAKISQTAGENVVSTADATASGTITTQNLVPAGTATASSAVAISLNGQGTVTIQVTGTYTGALSAQVTTDGTNWITVGGALLTRISTGLMAITIASGVQDIYQINVSGYAQLRITGLAAMTGTATVTLRANSTSSGYRTTLASSAGSEPNIAALTDTDLGATTVYVTSRGQYFNESNWDRQRGNTNLTIFASAARTSDPTPADKTNYNAKGLHVVLDCTVSGTGSITLTIQGKDSVSGSYYTLLAGAAVSSISTNVYKVYPNAPVTANVSAPDIIPRTFRVIVTHNNANTITYSVGASLIL